MNVNQRELLLDIKANIESLLEEKSAIEEGDELLTDWGFLLLKVGTVSVCTSSVRLEFGKDVWWDRDSLSLLIEKLFQIHDTLEDED